MVTETAVEDAMVSPLPSWPVPLNPQHFTAPPGRIAQCWLGAEARAMALPPSPTVTGAAELVLGSPLPSWPSPSEPQHRTLPSERRAQLLAPWEVSLLMVRQVEPVQPAWQLWGGGIMQAPFMHVPCAMSWPPEQSLVPQAPVGNWHCPSRRPAQVPAQVPLPQVPRAP